MSLAILFSLVLIIAFIVCFGMLITGLLWWSHPSSRRFRAVGGIGTIVCLICMAAIPCNFYGGNIALEAEVEVKGSLYSLHIALEAYGSNHDGAYPQQIAILIEDGYLLGFPLNPLTGKEMREIDFGSQPFEGNFTYLPVTDGDQITGYYLIAYGDDRREGDDVNGDDIPDHVILVLTNEPADSGTLPPLEELLQ